MPKREISLPPHSSPGNTHNVRVNLEYTKTRHCTTGQWGRGNLGVHWPSCQTNESGIATATRILPILSLSLYLSLPPPSLLFSLFLSPSLYLSLSPALYLSPPPSIYLSACLPACLSVCLCLSIYFSPSLYLPPSLTLSPPLSHSPPLYHPLSHSLYPSLSHPSLSLSPSLSHTLPLPLTLPPLSHSPTPLSLSLPHPSLNLPLSLTPPSLPASLNLPPSLSLSPSLSPQHSEELGDCPSLERHLLSATSDRRFSPLILL